MTFLILSILFNAYLGSIFAYFKKYNIDAFQAIVFNYITCVITGSFVLGHFPIKVATLSEPWFRWSVLMGILFISVFNLIAISSSKVGITITQTSNKLSLIIPVLFSYFMYHEPLSWLKIIGIVVALIAVVLTTKGETSKDSPTAKKLHWEIILPIVLFLSSGIIDTMTKYVEQRFLKHPDTSNAYLIAGFLVAAIIGTLVLSLQYISGKRSFAFKNLIAGIVLGIPNYFSIYYLIKALQSKNLSSSATIPINNIGVLFLVSIVGIFVFKEKLSKANLVGLLFTIAAIILIFLGDKI